MLIFQTFADALAHDEAQDYSLHLPFCASVSKTVKKDTLVFDTTRSSAEDRDLFEPMTMTKRKEVSLTPFFSFLLIFGLVFLYVST